VPKYLIKKDKSGKTTHVETSLSGSALLFEQKLNKGTAFTMEEREELNLLGKLPERIETLDEQVERCYQQYHEKVTALAKFIYLTGLHDSNEVLFYRLIEDHLEEMLPIIYTPTVGLAVQSYSLEYRRVRGVFLSYPNRKQMRTIIQNRFNQNIDLVLVTDGEGVLGIGDQGIGGMFIAIAKLVVYTLCGGVPPNRVLPIQLDVGTDNQQLLDDPLYLGWRHPRVCGKDYDDFISEFVSVIKEELPGAYLHWEDFGRENATRNLKTHRQELASFNDDMQGTGATVLACVLAAAKASGFDLSEHRIVMMGAGTAGMGITNQIFDAICATGVKPEDAYKQFWLIDRPGLLFSDSEGLTDEQKPFARSADEHAQWDSLAGTDGLTLLEVVQQAKPTILIGCSAVAGAFNEQVVKAMAEHVKHPIILPLSNPTSRSEAKPEDLVKWTNGKALIATGSPFDPVTYQGQTIRIAQSNNAFVFPGLGLGVIVCQATQVSDQMIRVAADTLSECSPARSDPSQPLLPSFEDIDCVSKKIALAVAEQARKEGFAGVGDEVDLKECVDHYFWKPQYLPIKKMER
jgi:malate dehydrogenase (oxaloacetate-decarboxylating)